MNGRSLAFPTAGLLYLATSSGSALAAGGASPYSAPVTGSRCYFISALSGATGDTLALANAIAAKCQ